MPIPDQWNAKAAAACRGPLRDAQLLRYRSNLLGADKRVTNYGGGNTSVKTRQLDPVFRRQVEVMWVKGSGGDLGSMDLDGFAVLRMDALQQLKNIYRGPRHEDEMAHMLPHCAFPGSKRAASIDTPLHAFVPYKHVDHVHPDAVIAIAAAADGEKLTRKVYGDRIGWLPWRRPGFELGLWLEDFVKRNPKAIGVVLGSHGLFTWADDPRECYKRTLWAINTAERWLRKRSGRLPFGRVAKPLAPAARRALAAKLLPAVRGLAGAEPYKSGHFVDSPEVLEFVSARKMEELAKLGTSCPDHFLRTKIRPLVIPLAAAEAAAAGDGKALAKLAARYRKAYASYYGRCRDAASPPIRDANAVVYLIPRLGMFTLGRDKATARIAAEYYVNAINVMRGAEGVSRYTGLREREAFRIEYWELEEAKLRRMPAPAPLAGRIALVTGAAGGIGGAIADRLLAEGANVALADIDAKRLDEAAAGFAARHGADRVRAFALDVTKEKEVARVFDGLACEYGGLDILVNCAGLSLAAPIEETDLAVWDKCMDVLATGYFLMAREAFRLLRRQDLGGSVVFIASKNGMAASPNASAYCAAKAAEVHLARCLALEGGAGGIRVNVVNPDAVLRDSRIWSSSWRRDRADAYGVGTGDLEEHYRQRSLLKRSVLPADVAEAVYFLASDAAAKSTGNVLNVDAGHPVAFPR
ncbi:MAG: bifunctional rhamnulose-1-phosphate aldolase/short-chain dehydrogenase [Betaproteobacteria bacterium AqS2]|uniref:Bifunctional rhamnulose-1-phosphate aldolase/short-chain dehydrogenase n=1 Tax=Candidatus Amphirhobacter heronislandensis TaxID=1732024 RepID=A0A930UI57_9GAMM|nr:bifunctional rhamnulose-1-phosphate aldolase/short-chain dehydrogenase [Betaproteobacteria bacterium AqS2]